MEKNWKWQMLVFWGMRSNFHLLITSISNYVHLNYQANFIYIVKGIFLLKSNVLWFLISLKKWIKSVVNSNSNNINNLDVWNKYRWQPTRAIPNCPHFIFQSAQWNHYEGVYMCFPNQKSHQKTLNF